MASELQQNSTEGTDQNDATIKPNQGNPRVIAMRAKLEHLQTVLDDIQAQRQQLVDKIQVPADESTEEVQSQAEKLSRALMVSNQLVKNRIQSLSRYNELRDIATGMIGLIAESRQERIVDVMEEFGVGEGD